MHIILLINAVIECKGEEKRANRDEIHFPIRYFNTIVVGSRITLHTYLVISVPHFSVEK